MSFIRITTIHPDGFTQTGVCEQAIEATEAFENRVHRLRKQSHTADRDTLTITIHPTDVEAYTQVLQYAETAEGVGEET